VTNQLRAAAGFRTRNRTSQRPRRARVELAQESGVSVAIQSAARVAAASGADLPQAGANKGACTLCSLRRS
jgi:hypothetical protein